jgi:hypothetical protein
MTVRPGHLISILATQAVARAAAMRGFLEVSPNGQRAFRNRNARPGTPGFVSSSSWPGVLCSGVVQSAVGRRGGGIAGQEKGFGSILGSQAGHTGSEK